MGRENKGTRRSISFNEIESRLKRQSNFAMRAAMARAIIEFGTDMM
jgi:hypothetical protein